MWSKTTEVHFTRVEQISPARKRDLAQYSRTVSPVICKKTCRVLVPHPESEVLTRTVPQIDTYTTTTRTMGSQGTTPYSDRLLRIRTESTEYYNRLHDHQVSTYRVLVLLMSEATTNNLNGTTKMKTMVKNVPLTSHHSPHRVNPMPSLSTQHTTKRNNGKNWERNIVHWRI